MDDASERALPPETTDNIIDHLYGNPATLASSSLVRRSWKARAQWRLYAKVFLRDRQAYTSLRCLRSDPSTRDFLKHQCGHTTHLEIIDDKDHPYAHAVPFAFSNLFPVLHTLVCHDAQWLSLPPDPAFFNALSTFHNVTTLEFDRCNFRNFRDLVRTICGFCNLSDLTITSTKLAKVSVHTVEPTIASLGNELRLRHLHVDDTCLLELLNWLSMTPSVDSEEKSLRILTIRPSHTAALKTHPLHRSLQALLQRLGSSVTALEIPVPTTIDGYFDLKANDCLQSLTLQYYFQHALANSWLMAWAKIAYCLVAIQPPLLSLRSIEFVFTIWPSKIAVTYLSRGPFALTQIEEGWKQADELLTSGAFPNLQKAVITFEWHIEELLPEAEVKRLQASIGEGLKKLECYERGIASIAHSEHPSKIPTAAGQGR